MKKGFTLIELLATVVILGIITAIATISISKLSESSRKKVLLANANTYIKSMQLENYDNVNICKDIKELGKKESSKEVGFVCKYNNEYYIYINDGKGNEIGSYDGENKIEVASKNSVKSGSINVPSKSINSYRLTINDVENYVVGSDNAISLLKVESSTTYQNQLVGVQANSNIDYIYMSDLYEDNGNWFKDVVEFNPLKSSDSEELKISEIDNYLSNLNAENINIDSVKLLDFKLIGIDKKDYQEGISMINNIGEYPLINDNLKNYNFNTNNKYFVKENNEYYLMVYTDGYWNLIKTDDNTLGCVKPVFKYKFNQ